MKIIQPLHYADLCAAYSLGQYIQNEYWQQIHESLYPERSWYRTSFHEKMPFCYNKYIDDKKQYYRLSYENLTAWKGLKQVTSQNHHYAKEIIRKQWLNDQIVLNIIEKIKYIIIEESGIKYLIIIGLRDTYKIEFN